MVEIRAFARRAPVRLASSDRRARIAALVMASSDAVEPAPRTRMPIAVGAIAALAAVAALVVWSTRSAPAEYAVVWPALPAIAPPGAAAPPPIVAPPAPLRDPSRVAHRTEVAPEPKPEPSPKPPAPSSAAKPATRVFAGSQEHRRDGELARDQVTLAPHAIIATARVVDPGAFEHGWTALREARYADAIAAFDQVVDPAVAEDAAYWAAIAAARAGDRDDATRRLNAFVASFPASERVGEARALLARLAP
jgi:hypothetical protein